MRVLVLGTINLHTKFQVHLPVPEIRHVPQNLEMGNMTIKCPFWCRLSSQDLLWPTYILNLKTLASSLPTIWIKTQN